MLCRPQLTHTFPATPSLAPLPPCPCSAGLGCTVCGSWNIPQPPPSHQFCRSPAPLTPPAPNYLPPPPPSRPPRRELILRLIDPDYVAAYLYQSPSGLPLDAFYGKWGQRRTLAENGLLLSEPSEQQ